MHKAILTLCALIMLGITPVYAMSHILNHIPNAKIVGEGRLTYLFMDVYDAALYAPEGSLDRAKPFALQLSYLREVSGQTIADRSLEEISDQGLFDETQLATWHTQMKNIFPDVDEGMALTGVHLESGETIFYLNLAEIGRITDPEFSKAFFGIWLNEKTNVPNLRRKLLGAV
jgi:hypothetical protein